MFNMGLAASLTVVERAQRACPVSRALSERVSLSFYVSLFFVQKIYFNKKLAQVKKRITFAPALQEARSGRLWEIGKRQLKKVFEKNMN